MTVNMFQIYDSEHVWNIWQWTCFHHTWSQLNSKYEQVVTVVSMSATNWEALVRIGSESWWQGRVVHLTMLIFNRALMQLQLLKTDFDWYLRSWRYTGTTCSDRGTLDFFFPLDPAIHALCWLSEYDLERSFWPQTNMQTFRTFTPCILILPTILPPGHSPRPFTP